MFKVIDRTLTALKLEENDFSDKKLLRMCELMVKLGADYIEISVPLLKKIGKLPEDGHYILRVSNMKEKRKYSGFDKYVMLFNEQELKESKAEEDILYEIPAKSINELMGMKTADFAGQIRITGLDSMLCKDYTEQVKKFVEGIKKKVDFCPGDSQYCATALAIEWLKKGGRSVSLSFNGIGGYAKLEEVLMGSKVILHKKIKQDLSVLPELSKLYEELTGKHINYNKAVVGKNIFNLEAGIQLESGAHNPVAYEPYEPEAVGKVRKIVIGKNSGCSAIKLKLREKGIKVPDELIKPLLEVVRNKSMGRGRSLTDREFFGLVQEVLADEA